MSITYVTVILPAIPTVLHFPLLDLDIEVEFDFDRNEAT